MQLNLHPKRRVVEISGLERRPLTFPDQRFLRTGRFHAGFLLFLYSPLNPPAPINLLPYTLKMQLNLHPKRRVVEISGLQRRPLTFPDQRFLRAGRFHAGLLLFLYSP